MSAGCMRMPLRTQRQARLRRSDLPLCAGVAHTLPFVAASLCSAYLTWRDGRTALLDCKTHLPIEDVDPEDYGFYAPRPATHDSPPAELPHRAHTMAKSHEVTDRVEAFLASLRE